MVHFSFSVSVREFSEESVCCSESCYLLAWRHLHPLNVCLRSVFSDPGCENTSTDGCVGNSNYILLLKARNSQSRVWDYL